MAQFSLQVVTFLGHVSLWISLVRSALGTDGSLDSMVPTWTAPAPNHTNPLGGFSLASGAVHTQVYHASTDFGTYNHAAMIDYHNNTFLIAWKNGADSEDKDGQRILYSQSRDGTVWTPTDGRNVLFPSLSTPHQESAMFVGPPIHIRGRQYVGASPGIPTGAAQGAQFCLWPDPLNPRNCGPPGQKQATSTLLMRQVKGFQQLGELFWASEDPPAAWATATAQYGIKRLADMDSTTQQDIATLAPDLPTLPCGPVGGGTLKCEACIGGCQLYSDIATAAARTAPLGSADEFSTEMPFDQTHSVIGNERAHYTIPISANTNGSGVPDVILYRSGTLPVLLASVRTQPGQKAWPQPVATNIPNDESNLNAGALPDGRVYLLNNPVFEPKTAVSARHNVASGTLRFRDPVVVATSVDGYQFNKAVAVVSCTALPDTTSVCHPRFGGTGKNPGPSYPQGLTVVAPAPLQHQGFYVVATNNKEDVWVTKLNFSVF
eukprot:m.428250 g.428250  ORF g.428250 m.428250 type:complete len:491 (+) comp21375_c0_seq4:217-1689(+)